MFNTKLFGRNRNRTLDRRKHARRTRFLNLEGLEDRSVPSAVTFLKTDSTTQGDWKGVYGQDGESVAGTTPVYPGYAQVAMSRPATKTWTTSTSDARATTHPTQSGRIASSWQGYTQQVALNLTDSQPHQVAFYVLDWMKAGRSESVVATDAVTGQTLDSRSVSDFEGGKYLVYNVSGRVNFTFTSLSGSSALLSAVFFDTPVAASPPATLPPPPVSPPPPPPANTVPAISDVTDQSVQAGQTAGPLSFTVSDAETAAGSLTVTASSSNTALVPSAGITLGGSGGSWTVSVTPAAGQTGTATITLTVTDAGGLSATDTFTLTVTSPPPPPAGNTLPTISDVPDQTTGKDRTAGPLSFTVSDAETAAGSLTVTASSSNTALVPSAGITLGGSGGSRTVSVTPAAGQTGTATITLTVADAGGLSATDTFTLTVVDPAASGGVVVTADWITTEHDKIPNFGGNPTLTSARSGPWSDPLTWGGRLPAAGEVVSITSGMTVTYDLVSDVELDTVAIQAGGSLQFRTDMNTRLRVTNLLVMPDSTLTIGTVTSPVQAAYRAEVIINDLPIDTAKDPQQYGHGLIGLGTVSMHGSVMSDTFVRLAAEPMAGDTTLQLSVPVTGWRVGDRLVLPDSRQLGYNDIYGPNPVDELERPLIAAVSADGLTITLTAPLAYDHPGARDLNGVLTFLPHVANQTRNVVVRSENMRGTRGHAMFTGRADVDIRYTQFGGLGRSKIDAWDNTQFDTSGNVTHVGTNQMGRYPVHFHHLVGPTTPQSNGYQFTFEGNSVFCPLDPMPFRWGVVMHDAQYGLVKDNVLYNWAGGGIVGEDAAAIKNTIEENFISHIVPAAGRPRADSRGFMDTGFEGAGVWLRSVDNAVRNNVVANAGFGYQVFSTATTNTVIPAFQGADPTVSGQSKTVDMTNVPLLAFEGNEVYGGDTYIGLELWSIGTNGRNPHADALPSVVKDLRVWHVWHLGYSGYETNRLTFDGLVFRGADATLFSQERFPEYALYSADYFQTDFTIRNSDIQGALVGWYPSTDAGDGVQTIENTYMRNYTNIHMQHLWSSGGTSSVLRSRTVVVRDVTFDQIPNPPSWAMQNYGPQVNIRMMDAPNSAVINYVMSDRLFVYNYNGNVGNDFQVFYKGQAADAIVPLTTYYSNGAVIDTGAPVAGLTNTQAWVQYGVAVAGAVAPDDATTMDLITGLVKPI